MPRREAGLRACGAGGERGYAGLSSLLRGKREPEMVRAPVRGAERFFAGLSSLLRAKREPEKHQLRAPVRGAERFFIKANVLF